MTTSAKKRTLQYNLANGILRNNADKVFQLIALRPNGVTTYQLRLHGIAHQTLTATLSNLHDLGLIKVIEVVQTNDSWYSKYQKVEDEIESLSIQRERLKEKMDRWIKCGLNEFGNYLSENMIAELNSLIDKNMMYLNTREQ
jgi:hypothetical protein